MNRLLTAGLRVVLVILVLGATLAQVLVPIVADAIGEQFPEVAHLVVPYSVAAILAIACVEAVMVIVWRLLSLITADAIFTSQALRWVDGITLSVAIATALAAGVTGHLVGIVQVGGPGVALALMASVAGGFALLLLMAVMRGLLQAAAAYRGELDEVI